MRPLWLTAVLACALCATVAQVIEAVAIEAAVETMDLILVDGLITPLTYDELTATPLSGRRRSYPNRAPQLLRKHARHPQQRRQIETSNTRPQEARRQALPTQHAPRAVLEGDNEDQDEEEPSRTKDLGAPSLSC